MEESIKILEEKIYKMIIEIAVCRCNNDVEYAQIIDKEKQALENLIKGYRELEKHNINLSEQLQMAKGGMIIANLDAVGDFIPKSKIKEKIEEWDKSIKWNNTDDRYYAIKILQELLEEEY